MKKTLSKILNILAKPLIGKGILDTYFPKLNIFFQRFYASLQTDLTKLIALPNGQKMLVYSQDVCSGISLILTGKYEQTTTNLFLENVKTGNIVLDIGANNGYYSLLASKKIGKQGQVYAFEPDKNNLVLLRKNILLNKISNIKVFDVAVSDKIGTVQFSSDSIHTGKSTIILDNKGNNQIVKCVALDTFFKKIKIDTIIMDIEGAEFLALKGAKKTFKNNNITLFFEYNPKSIKSFDYQPQELIENVNKLGFNSISIIDETRSKVIPYSENNLRSVMDHTTYCNFMCKKI